MRGGVVAVDAAAEHGDGGSSGVERSAMRFPVDAARKAADDDEPCGGELAREAARNRRAVAGARARTDDRDRRSFEHLRRRSPTDEEAGGRIVDRAQERREI